MQLTIARSGIQMALSLTSAISIGVWINLLTNNARGTWLEAFRATGAGNLGLAIAILAAAGQVLLAWRWWKIDRIATRKFAAALKDDKVRALRAVLRVAVDSARALHPNTSVNARYFSFVRSGNRQYLVKDRRLHIDTVPMPVEYGLERVEICEPGIVMCDAVVRRASIYEELEPEHTNRYSPTVRHLVDPRQRWVLACPVLRLDDVEGDVAGVVVFYGDRPPARTPAAAGRLQQMSVAAAEALATILAVGSEHEQLSVAATVDVDVGLPSLDASVQRVM